MPAVKRQNRRRSFTARTLGRIVPEVQPVDWFDEDCPGLSLRVSPGGARTWYFFYRHGRTVRRVKLGTFPAVELAKARILAREQRSAVETTGADPAHERKGAREVYTVADLADLYMLVHAKPKKRTWPRDQQRINLHLKPAWGSRSVPSITRADVHALLDNILAEHGPIEANRTKSLIGKMWNVALDRGHAETNPCYRMAKPAPERVRENVVDDDGLKQLCASLTAHQARPSPRWRPEDAAEAMHLRLLTAQRGGQVFEMTWPEVDLDDALWTIPGSKMKNGKPHVVPLSDAALVILRRRHGTRDEHEPRVFPGMYHQRDDVRDLATIHGHEYRWHDLRRVFTTRLTKLGVSRDMCGRVLSHVKSGVTAVHYDANEYLDEKRAALDVWAREIDRIVKGPTTAKVIAHQPRRRS